MKKMFKSQEDKCVACGYIGTIYRDSGTMDSTEWREMECPKCKKINTEYYEFVYRHTEIEVEE